MPKSHCVFFTFFIMDYTETDRFQVQGSGLKGYNHLKPLMILLGLQNILYNPMGERPYSHKKQIFI
jgi:hypothetical protein